MLNKEKMIPIARKECIKMLGEEFYEKHKDNACYAKWYGWDGVFYCAICIDSKPHDDTNKIMGGETPYEYVAIVGIEPATGSIARNLKDSILPSS